MTTCAILKSDIVSQTGHSWTTAEQSTIVRLAEAMIARDVKIKEMLTTDDAFVINSRRETLPAGLLEVKKFRLTSTNGYLDFLPLDLFYDAPVYSDSGTPPSAYTIEGTNFVFAPEPTTGYTALLSYIKRLDALTADSDTNWLLTNHYDVYLWSCLSVAFGLAQDDEQASKWLSAYTAVKDKLNTTNQWSASQPNKLRRFGVTGP
jgi:hypothetical protein